MKLSEFITETILEVLKGVTDAQKRKVDIDDRASINPFLNGEVTPGLKLIQDGTSRVYQVLDFDIAVTVSESTDDNVGAKLNVSVLSLGGQLSEQKAGTSNHRVQFSIPVEIPSQDQLPRQRDHQ